MTMMIDEETLTWH